jgi:hypothetical protein
MTHAPVVPPLQVPGSPTDVAVSVHYGSDHELEVDYTAPASDGGSPILKYRIEYNRATDDFDSSVVKEVRCSNYPQHAIWTVKTTKTTSDITSDSFTLNVVRAGVSEQTDSIAWDAVAMATDEPRGSDVSNKSVQSRLQHLSHISDVQVVRHDHSNTEYSWDILFLDDGDVTLTSTDSDANVFTTGLTQLPEHVGVPASSYDCLGTQLIGDGVGAGLDLGVYYYVRVSAYNTVDFGFHADAGAAEKPMVRPSRPTGVTVSVESATSLRVYFAPPHYPGGDVVDQYMVEWATASDFNNADNAVITYLPVEDVTMFTYVIESLTMGTTYYVRVYAHNSQGYSDAQSSTPTSEHPRQFPDAPTNVNLVVTSQTMLTVSFDLPVSNGGDTVTDYKIEWDRDASFNSLDGLPHKGSEIVDATAHNSYTIGSYTEPLSSSSVYYVRVSARNAEGFGQVQTADPYSAQPSTQTPGLPSNVAVQCGSTPVDGEVVVTWDAPVVPYHGIFCGGTGSSPVSCPLGLGRDFEADGGSTILYYTVSWESGYNSGSENVAVDGTEASYTHTITGLNKLYTYKFAVRAFNAAEGVGQRCLYEGNLCDGNRVERSAAC